MTGAAGRGTVALKFALVGFVALSIGYAVYKAAGAPAAPATAPVEVVQPAAAPAAPVKPQAAARPSAEKTALVYYFYTNTRCSSCKTIEDYTREAVEKNFASGYKGWKVVFRGVNVDEAPNAHFVQDYWLNSKSVVVQKFSGEKALKWGKLEKVWQLLGDKEAFIQYVTAEIQKLLDGK